MRFKNLLPITLVPLLGIALQGATSNVDELIQKNIDARGGLQRIRAVKTMKMSGAILVRGTKGKFTLLLKRPHFVRMEMYAEGSAVVQAYDGTTAWSMNSSSPGVAEKVPEAQAKTVKEQADFDGPLVDYQQKGNTIELVGREKMETYEAYKLRVTLKNGDVRYFYLDTKSFLERRLSFRQKEQAGEVEVDTYLDDYKSVNGIMVPYSFETRVGGTTVTQSSVENVEINTALDDSLFRMPEKTGPIRL
ncbi:MAG TPA: hypothetical protein VGL91_07835 [Acidobacteriota bacterium]